MRSCGQVLVVIMYMIYNTQQPTLELNLQFPWERSIQNVYPNSLVDFTVTIPLACLGILFNEIFLVLGKYAKCIFAGLYFSSAMWQPRHRTRSTIFGGNFDAHFVCS